MVQTIMLRACEVSKHYVHTVSMAEKHNFNGNSMAQNIMQTAFRWIKTLCEQRFDGSRYYASSNSMAQNITLTAIRWFKNYVNSVFIAQNIM